MSEIRPDGGSGIGGSPRGGSLYRYVVIASHESAAPLAALASRADVLLLDPMRAPDADLIGPLQPPIDGPEEIAIPRWAVYDCAEVPGAVIGQLREPIESPCDRPLDPLALVVATPHAEAGDWHLYGLTVRRAERPIDEVRCSIIAAAIELLAARRVTLTVPWTSPLLAQLAGTGPTEVLAARTLLHGPGAVALVAVWSKDRWDGAARAQRVQLGAAGLADRVELGLDAGERFILAARCAAPPRVGEVRP